VENDDYARQARVPRFIPQPFEKMAVPAVDTVELADGHR
jgi:hypothetical protein